MDSLISVLVEKQDILSKIVRAKISRSLCLRVLLKCLLGNLCPRFTSEIVWPSVLLDQYLLEICILHTEKSDLETFGSRKA